jgi:O-methyltransferase involved in polyketide biosynthesis
MLMGMRTKINVNPSNLLKESVQSSSLLSLKYRVQGYLEGVGAYEDVMGEYFYNRIDFDWSRYNHAPAYRSVVIRTEIIDGLVSNLLNKGNADVVVNLGAGFCTRYYRSNAKILWIEVDLPEVINLRRMLGEPKRKNHSFIAASLTSEDLYKKLKKYHGKRAIVIAEGILMYLDETANIEIMQRLLNLFRHGDFIIEVMSPTLLTLKNIYTTPKFRWGLASTKDLTGLNNKMKLVDEFYYSGKHLEILSGFRRFLEEYTPIGKLVKIIWITV